MKPLTRRELFGLAGAAGMASLAGPRLFAQRPYYPRGAVWDARSPRDAGMDPAAIDEAVRYAGEHNSTGLMIVRGGRIVTEQYWSGWTQQTSQPIFSSSKSLTATLIGMAIEEGVIKGVNQMASDFIAAWKGTPKAAVTVRHMLTMTSGIR